MQWEYKAERVSFDMVDKLEALLNEFGSKGWELAYFREVTDLGGVTTSHCIFKRPVEEIGVGINGITVEGESGEMYYHYHSDPTLTRLTSALEQGAIRQGRVRT